MYEHPPAPLKDGSPLENQQVEQAAMEEQKVVNEEPLVVRVSDALPQAQANAKVLEENRYGATTGAIENLILNEVAAAAPETGAEQERRPEGIEVLAEALRASESAEAEQQIRVEENREENAQQPDENEEKAQDLGQSQSPAA